MVYDPLDGLCHHYGLEFVHGVDVTENLPEEGIGLIREYPLGYPLGIWMIGQAREGGRCFLVIERSNVHVFSEVHTQINSSYKIKPNFWINLCPFKQRGVSVAQEKFYQIY